MSEGNSVIHVYKNEEGKIQASVPVTYEMYGRVNLVFDSLEEMEQSLKERDYIDEMPLPRDDFYVDGSYTINEEQFECEIIEAKEEGML